MRPSPARSVWLGGLLVGCLATAISNARGGPPAPPSPPPPAENTAPPAAAAAQASDPATDVSTEVEWAEQPAGEPLTLQALTALIQEQRYDEAIQRLDQTIAMAARDHPAQPDADGRRARRLPSRLGIMYRMLSGAIGDDPADDSLTLLRRIIDSALAEPTLQPATAVGAATAIERLALRDSGLSPGQQLEWIEQLDQKTQGHERALAEARVLIVMRQVSQLLATERPEEARVAMDKLVATARAKAETADGQSMLDFVELVNIYRLILGKYFPERVVQLAKEAERLTANAMAQEQIEMPIVIAYFSVHQRRVSRLLSTDPLAAAEVVEEMETALAKARERLDPAAIPSLSTYTQTLRSLSGSVNRALRLAALIGSEAPPIDAEAFIGSEPLTMADLRGKVVLINFCAVWRGPCIDALPRLIQWHESYADRGLVILGATRYYGYRWDDQAERPVRGSDVSHDEEHAMLEKFRQAHRLPYPLFVTSNRGEYQSAYCVSGIPHAVLIDHEGKIQMVRAGASEAAARDLQEKIEQLLAARPTAF